MIDLSLLVALSLASVVAIGLLFLPAVIELKRPRDAGPRLIDDLFEKERSESKGGVDCEFDEKSAEKQDVDLFAD